MTSHHAKFQLDSSKRSSYPIAKKSNDDNDDDNDNDNDDNDDDDTHPG